MITQGFHFPDPQGILQGPSSGCPDSPGTKEMTKSLNDNNFILLMEVIWKVWGVAQHLSGSVVEN